MLVYGGSGVGKSKLCCDLIRNNKIITPKISRIFYLYVYWEEEFDKLLQDVPTVRFVKSFEELEGSIDGRDHVLIVIDDQTVELDTKSGARYVTEWFTRKSSHLNASIIVCLHNMFMKNMRTVALNSTHNVFFNSVRDRQQFLAWSRQLYPHNSKAVLAAFLDSVSGPFGFLFANLLPDCPESQRLRNFIWANDNSKQMKFYPIQNDVKNP